MSFLWSFLGLEEGKKSGRDLIEEKMEKSIEMSKLPKNTKRQWLEMLGSKKMMKLNFKNQNDRLQKNVIDEYISDDDDLDEKIQRMDINSLSYQHSSFVGSRSDLIGKREKIAVNMIPTTTGIKMELNIVPDFSEEGFEFIQEEWNEEEIQKQSILSELLRIDENRTKIKLCFSNTRGGMMDNVKKMSAPTLNLVNQLPEYGFLHTSLIIGAYKLEWNSSGLTYPRPAKATDCVCCIDLYSINTNEELEALQDKVLDVVVKWNTTIYYAEALSDPIKQKTGNCQQFVDDLIDHLGIRDTLKMFPEYIHKYISSIRNKGTGEMTFEMTPRFQRRFEVSGSSKHFKKHADLDRFLIRLNKKGLQMNRNYLPELMLLKAFDRAFWLMKRKVDMEGGKKVHTDFEPEMCPFGDPDLSNSIPDMFLSKKKF